MPCRAAAYHHDGARPPRAHVGQDGVRDIDDSHDVRLELLRGGEGSVGHGRSVRDAWATGPWTCHAPSLLHQGFQTVSGVVDDDIDAPPDGQGLIHGLLYVLRGVTHVQYNDAQPGAVADGQGKTLEIAHGCDNVVATFQYSRYKALAES